METREPLAKNVAGHLRGLLGDFVGEKESANSRGGGGNRGKGVHLCGCGELRDEEMIECAVGKKCGGWVHYSCAGIEMGSHQDSDEPFICRWCRAEGVNLQEARKEKEEREKEKEREKERAMQEKEEEKMTMRLRSRKKLREKWDVARYSGYGHASRESIQDEDYEQ